jgi:hypothetical protein
MALTADREYGCTTPDEFLSDIAAGAADTLYKGAIVSIGTDGLLKVPDAVSAEVPIGLMKQQVVAAGLNAEYPEIDTGILAVEKKAQQTTTVAPGTGGVLNVNYKGKYFQIFDGTTPYCCWFNVGTADTDPTIADPTLGTSVEIAIATGDNAAAVGTAIAAAIDGIGGGGGGTVFGATGTTTVTIVNVNRGKNTIANTGDCTCITLVNTINGTVGQADVGTLVYAIADDGVVPAAQNGSADVALGLCVGLVGSNNELWIDTFIKSI